MERVERLLLSSDTIESLLCSIELGAPDDSLTAAAVSVVLDGQREDGSWQGSLLRTAETLLLLHGMRAPSSVAIDRAIEYVLARAGAEGAYPPNGFAAAPPSVDLSGLHLMTGLSIGTDRDARFGASARALSALGEWDALDAMIAAQTAVIADTLRSADCALSTTAFVLGTHALLAAGAHADSDAALLQLTRSQRGDGSWPGVELFLVLDLFAAAQEKGKAPAGMQRALELAVDNLSFMQQPDGGWGRGSQPWQLLSGWRALRAVTSVTAPPDSQ